ncbi:MAG: SRPBCC family protein [Dysgonamonadaceae bacterium]|jgi:carbon monoxide dehydrogenase subunit G|nr:SRPBCC family protein [Dysgonamonadaceae bacterium]
MTEFVSQIKTLPYDEKLVYTMLSDLSNLEQVKDRIPADKIRDVTFDRDSCRFSANPVGEVKITIVDREPFKTIKFMADESPMGLYLWIQLKQTGENDTKMKITAQVDLSPFLKPMLSKPLQEGVDKIADVLAAIRYK